MNIDEGEMYMYNYFPTNVAETYIKDYRNINKEITSKIYNLKKENTKKIIRSNTGGWHSSDNLHHLTEFKNIHDKILEAINVFVKQFNYDDVNYDLKIVNMWSIVNKKYDYNQLHSHYNSLWRGI